MACTSVDDVDPVDGQNTSDTPGMFPPTPPHPQPLGEAPPGASAEQQDALWWVNTYRAQAGLGPVAQLATINEAASAHAKYLVHHPELYDEGGLSVHQESPDYDGFWGVHYWERLDKAGYTGEALAEVVTFQPQAISAVAHCIESLYHRLPLLHPAAKHIGYGAAEHLGRFANVLDVGTTTGAVTIVSQGIPWPPPGAHGVPLTWDGLEEPQPPSPPTGFPSGPIVTLGFSDGAHVVLGEHALIDVTQDSLPVAHVSRSPDNDVYLDEHSAVALYAHDPLEPGHTYEVRFQGTSDGVPFDRSWAFVTRPTSGCDPLLQNCEIGKACYSAESLTGVCYWIGSKTEGQACTAQNECHMGLTCLKSTGRCEAYCGINVGGPLDCLNRCEGGYIELDAALQLGVCKDA